jgi:hypothetical protein
MKCNDCNNILLPGSQVCEHCGSKNLVSTTEVEPVVKPVAQKKTIPKNLIFVIVGGIVFIGLVGCGGYYAYTNNIHKTLFIKVSSLFDGGSNVVDQIPEKMVGKEEAVETKKSAQAENLTTRPGGTGTTASRVSAQPPKTSSPAIKKLVQAQTPIIAKVEASTPEKKGVDIARLNNDLAGSGCTSSVAHDGVIVLNCGPDDIKNMNIARKVVGLTGQRVRIITPIVK